MTVRLTAHPSSRGGRMASSVDRVHGDHVRSATMHAFSSATEFSEQLLAISGEPDLEDARFLARNFRLERTLAPERTASYLGTDDIDLGAGPLEERVARWNEHHDRYLKNHVRGGWRGDLFDASSAAAPETFRVRTNLDEYGHADDAIDLVRLEDLAYIAALAGANLDRLRTLVERVALERRSAAGSATSAQARELDDILLAWQESPRTDNRPIFACFWEHARTTLEDPPDGWADELRDRLGMAHHDPRRRRRAGGMDVLAFRYPVKLVPRASRAAPRLIARPTVLDDGLSPSFFTFRAGSGRGCAVDLKARADEPWQEVVHPAVTFAAAHVWACGVVRKPAPASLEDPRFGHYLAIRESADDDYRDFIDAIEDP